MMASARSPDDFLRAAQVYGKLLNRGVRNGPIFYDLGTAFLKADRYEEAQALLLRAERYMGSDPDIERNMMLAMAKGKKDAPVALPWYRFLLFWHYGLSGPVRMTITACAFLCFWLALTLRTLGPRRIARRLLILSLAVLVLFGSSVLTSLHQESVAGLAVSVQAGSGSHGQAQVPSAQKGR